MLTKASEQLLKYALENCSLNGTPGWYQMNMVEHQGAEAVFINKGKELAAYVSSEVDPS